MATTKSTTTRAKSTTTRAAPKRTTTAKARSTASSNRSAAQDDDTIVAKTGRQVKERPYTSAAIATGAVAAAAAVGAAGAFLYARRDKGLKVASEELSAKVKGGIASATESVKGGIASATETVKDLAERGTGYIKGDSASDANSGNGETRSQREIAEEAMALKESGADDKSGGLTATEIKAGAIAY